MKLLKNYLTKDNKHNVIEIMGIKYKIRKISI